MIDVGPSCEPWGTGLLEQPGSAWTSLVFVAFGALIIWEAMTRHRRGLRTRPVLLGVMAVGNGIGSFIQHGPAPSWDAVVHDPPLMGALAVVFAFSAADIRRRPPRHSWWIVPTVGVAILAVAWPLAASAAMGVAAAPAIGAAAWRAVVVPDVRRRTFVGLGILATGAVVGQLSRVGAPACIPGSAFFNAGWSGHMLWHIASAIALWILAPTLQSASNPSGEWNMKMRRPEPKPESGALVDR